jgi:flavin-dependent dehydrogenase
MAGIDVSPGGAFMTGSQAEATVEGLDATRVYLGSKVAPGSFGWVVPIAPTRALVGLVTRQKLNGHMSDFVSALRTDGTIDDVVESPQRWGIPVRPLSRTYGERVMVVGDAAGLAKPTTGGGIYYALLSGELAASTLDEALSEDDLSARRLKKYEQAWKSKLGKELKIGYYARLMYEALGDRQIEFLLKEIMSDRVRPDLLDSDDVSFDWHSGFIKQALAHRTVGRALLALGPAGLQSVAGGIRSLAG